MVCNWTRPICGTCFWFSVTGGVALKRPCRQPDNLREAAMEAVRRYPWERCPRWAADVDDENHAPIADPLSTSSRQMQRH
jgi:hypothetical protein